MNEVPKSDLINQYQRLKSRTKGAKSELSEVSRSLNDDVESEWWDQQRRLGRRRRRSLISLLLYFGAGFLFAAFVWSISCVSGKISDHKKYLSDRGCDIISHSPTKAIAPMIIIPGRTCYRCSKTGEEFCE